MNINHEIDMGELISGEEAKIAWANGQDVEFRILDSVNHKNWKNIYDVSYGFNIHDFDSDEIDFRLKPSTIYLNGIEVPAPFKPKEGEEYWVISDEYHTGYTQVTHPNVTISAWRTEEEIKQVVAALRSVFGKK